MTNENMKELVKEFQDRFLKDYDPRWHIIGIGKPVNRKNVQATKSGFIVYVVDDNISKRKKRIASLEKHLPKTFKKKPVYIIGIGIPVAL